MPMKTCKKQILLRKMTIRIRIFNLSNSRIKIHSFKIFHSIPFDNPLIFPDTRTIPVQITKWYVARVDMYLIRARRSWRIESEHPDARGKRTNVYRIGPLRYDEGKIRVTLAFRCSKHTHTLSLSLSLPPFQGTSYHTWEITARRIGIKRTTFLRFALN